MPARILRRVGDWLGMGGDGDTPTLSVSGFAVLALAAFVLAVATIAVIAASRIESLLDDVARDAVASLEESLDEIGGELAATDTLAPAGCEPQTVDYLVRASLASRYARRIFLVGTDDDLTCAPLSGEELLSAHAADIREAAGSMRLTLAPGRDGTRYLLAARRGANARTIVAQIDIDRLIVDLPFHLLPFGRQLRVRDVLGRTLMHSTTASRVQVSLREPVIQRRRNSGRYGLRISAGADPEMIRAALGERTGAILGLFLLMLAGGIAGIRWWIWQHVSVERRLRRAVRARQFEPVIQPIVDARSGACVGGEVLMRWNHPARGMVAPVDFIALAEQTGLIVPMSRMLMTKARDRLAPIAAEDPGLRFAFNLSATELRDPELPDRIAGIFDEVSLPATQVSFELIERDIADARVRDSLARLRARGHRVAIDDFGTGQSNLSVLGQIGFDRLKIDREFVRSIDAETVNRPVLDTIIDLSRRLGVVTVAEGVETEAQRAYLVENGVDMLQGYLIARPMPIEQFAEWLDENRACCAASPRRPDDAVGPAAGSREVQHTTRRPEDAAAHRIDAAAAEPVLAQPPAREVLR